MESCKKSCVFSDGERAFLHLLLIQKSKGNKFAAQQSENFFVENNWYAAKG